MPQRECRHGGGARCCRRPAEMRGAMQRAAGTTVSLCRVSASTRRFRPVHTLEQVRQVLTGTQAMEFQAAADDEARYA